MSAKDMLGAVVRNIVALPAEMLGAILDFSEKLLSEAGGEWLTEFKKFLRKEQSWTGVVAKKILRLISGGEILTIEGLDGQEYIGGAKEVFKGYIDDDFKNYGLNQAGDATPETAVQVHELIEDASFAKMFTSLTSDLDKLCLTQHQIKRFCVKYPNWLRQEGYATFFLLKMNGEYFVALVYVSSDGLFVYVRRFERDDVWFAEYRYRLVVPQL
ncbi:MAG: hypothetical protein PHE24_06990 [Patescibacteria group bacterium]|nr:hypothetical protein [Patescibacteria group bacterium]